MRRKLHAIFICFILSLCMLGAKKSYASHDLGSEIFYACTATPGVYNVTLKVYVDCAGIPLCSNCPTSLSPSCYQTINITGASGTYAGTSFGTADLYVVTALSAIDAIQLCNSQKSFCTNCGTRTSGTYSPGKEVYVFTGQVNLSGLPASCCMVSLNRSACCRSSAATSIANPTTLSYYNEAIVNRCASPCNSSPVFNIPADFILFGNSDAVLNIGASDPDGDSLVYNLAPTLTAAGTSALYATPYSAAAPFPYLGVPLQSPPAVLPYGINTNHISGDVQFRPQSGFGSNFVMEVSQWKNIAGVPTLMGKNRRDHQIYFSSGAYGALAAIKKYDTTGAFIGVAAVSENKTICAGQTFCRNFVASTSGAADTTYLSWSSPVNMPGGNLYTAL